MYTTVKAIHESILDMRSSARELYKSCRGTSLESMHTDLPLRGNFFAINFLDIYWLFTKNGYAICFAGADTSHQQGQALNGSLEVGEECKESCETRWCYSLSLYNCLQRYLMSK